MLIQSFMFHANLAARIAAPWSEAPWVLSGIRVAEHQKHWHLVIDRLTSFLTNGSVCVSQGVFRFSLETARIDARRLTVVPNGIDSQPFDQVIAVERATIGIPADAHLALYIGRLDPQKGLPDLLRASELVLGQCPHWHLALVGDGPCRAWLTTQIAERHGMRGRIHWLGRRDNVPGLLKSADVLVHASLWEGMPNVVLEAMAARRPVIATAVEGTEDLVVPGLTGWLVPVRSHEALADALIAAARSPEQCQTYGNAGRRRVDAQFSINETVRAYESLWAKVLGFEATKVKADLITTNAVDPKP
jgi:starch synthase (maltosyl-transferring)